MNIFQNLNEQQQKAVKITEGPVLVLAGAGSGKTRTLTHRIAYLIGVKLVLPHRILAVTFTNKAALEMKERVTRLLSEYSSSSRERIPRTMYARMPVIGTFHAICARILREEAKTCGLTSHFTILDQADQLRVVKQALKNLDISPSQVHPKKVLSYIDRAKQELVDPSRFQEFYADTFQSPMDELVASLYEGYQRQLQSSNAVDFGDLLSYVVCLWRDNREILEKYQRRFHYVLVDEYQDTNSVQYEFCHLLSREHKNLFVVGDDCQSIYSFRGARIENILNFSKDNRGAQNVVLDQNYRSTQQILNVANAVIAKNVSQQKKVLWTDNKKGKKPQIVEVMDEVEEAEFVSELATDMDLNNFVVLYRTNAQSRIIEEAFLNEGIPYRIVGGVRFYDRKEIKDIIGYLRIILNPSDSISLERVINTPSRGVGQKTWEALKRSLQLYPGQFDKIASLAASPKVASFFTMIQTLAKRSEELNVAELITEVVEVIGYKDFLANTEENFEERMLNINELKSRGLRFANSRKGSGLTRFLEEISLFSDIDALETKERAVTLMTAHAVKGLEFDTVCMVGMEQGIFPYASSFSRKEELEEERRLCYVGITRAKKELYFTHTRSRAIYGETRFPELSQFLSDLGDELAEREIY